jgi:hypothetical protein
MMGADTTDLHRYIYPKILLCSEIQKDIEEQDGEEKSEQGQNEKTLDEMEKNPD